MTSEELKQYRFLKKEISSLQSEIEELHNTLKSPSLSGSNGSGVSDKVAKSVELITGKEKILQGCLARCIAEEKRIFDYIYRVPNSKIRQIMKLKYIDGLNWVQIGNEFGESAESLKMAYRRYRNGRFYGK